MWKGRIDGGLIDRQDGIVFPDVGLTSGDACYGRQGFIDCHGHHFVLDSPTKAPPDSADELVDVWSRSVRVDHRLTNGLESQRPEPRRKRVAVADLEIPQGDLDTGQFIGRTSVLDVVPIGKLAVGSNQFDDGCIVIAVGGELPTVLNPLADQPIVFEFAGLRLVRT
jgi:hypothetical protein